MLSQAAISAIGLYQRWLSPRKGFSCAHRVLHNGPSCSEYAKGVCREKGLWATLSALRERFRECQEANRKLRSRRVLMTAVYGVEPETKPGEGFEFAGQNTGETATDVPPGEPKKRTTRELISDGCDGLSCLCAPLELFGACA